MAEVFKRLFNEYGGGMQYTVPENTSVVISSINIINAGGSDLTFNMWIHQGTGLSYSADNFIYYEYKVKYQETLVLEPGITLSGGHSITIDISQNDNAIVSIFGSEVSDFTGYKILGQGVPNQSALNIYQNNYDSTSLVRSIVLCNLGNSDDYASIYLATGDYQYNEEAIAKNLLIRPRETVRFSSRYPVENGHRIFVESSLPSNIAFTVFGVEDVPN